MFFSLSLLIYEEQKRPSCNFISQAKKNHIVINKNYNIYNLF